MPDPITPKLPDPQASVDAALGSMSSTAATTTATTPLELPKVEGVKAEEPTMESLKVDATVRALPETPSVTATGMTLPSTPQSPNLPTDSLKTPEIAPVTMGDDTPLAFAAATLNAEPTTTVMSPQDAMSSVQQSTVLPPVPPAPNVGNLIGTDKSKSKSKLSIVIAVAVLVMIGIGGGSWGYLRYQNNIEINRIIEDTGTGVSIVRTNKEEERSQADFDNTGELNERGTVVQTNGTSINTLFDNLVLPNGYTAEPTTDIKHGCQVANDGLLYLYRGQSGVADTCAPIDLVNQALANLEGPNMQSAKIDCNAWWEDSQKGYREDNVKDSRSADNPCDKKGCTLTPAMKAAGCIIQKVNCRNGGGPGISCDDAVVAEYGNGTAGDTSAGKIDKLTCGSQQIDIICKDLCNSTRPIAFSNAFTNTQCKSDEKITETPPPSPTPFACTGLTQSPIATPKIGDKLTFTCAGDGTFFEFRYNLNNGAYKSLANKTNTTAELTISACGTYEVQCHTCKMVPATNGTMQGDGKFCDPKWTGALQ